MGHPFSKNLGRPFFFMLNMENRPPRRYESLVLRIFLRGHSYDRIEATPEKNKHIGGHPKIYRILMSREYCKTPSPTCILHGLEAIPLGRDRYRFFFQKSSDTKRHWPLKARELCAPTSLDHNNLPVFHFCAELRKNRHTWWLLAQVWGPKCPSASFSSREQIFAANFFKCFLENLSAGCDFTILQKFQLENSHSQCQF